MVHPVERAAEEVGAESAQQAAPDPSVFAGPSLKVLALITATAIAWCGRWPSIPLARLTLKRRRPARLARALALLLTFTRGPNQWIITADTTTASCWITAGTSQRCSIRPHAAICSYSITDTNRPTPVLVLTSPGTHTKPLLNNLSIFPSNLLSH